MKKTLVILLATIFHLHSFAQPGALDLSFTGGPNGSVNAIAIQPDGKILIGGNFSGYRGTIVRRIARVHPDGSLDTTFHSGTGLNWEIRSLLVQPDGKIIAGGDFTVYDSVAMNRIVRLNTDGSADTFFHAGSGFNDRVYALALQSDGKIVAGGLFTGFNGIACNRLARLNGDGSYDTTFNTIIGASASVTSLAIQPDEKIVIGGDFNFYGNAIHFKVARVNADGSPDIAFVDSTGAGSVVDAVALQPDGKILIGGNFTQFNLQTQNHLARLDSNGGLDPSFFVDQGADAAVHDIEVLNNGNVLIAGDFSMFKNSAINHLALVDEHCNPDTMFHTGTGADNSIHTLALQSDGKILAGGAFEYYNGEWHKGIVRLYNCLTSQPGIISGNDSVMCPNATLTYSIAPLPGADSYEWTLPAGWTGSSNSTSITVISNGQGGLISVRAFSDSCGYSDAQTKTVYQILPPEIPICLVTVDTASTHNILIWEKPADKSLIDSFFIYRETSTNVYSKIGAVHRDSLSAYHDYAADPNVTSYRYKISILDICGVESAQSFFHNTIHLQNLGLGNFQWTFYQIEATPNPVINFKVYRDNLGNGNFTQIGFVPGTNSTFTDNNYSLFDSSVYVVDVDWVRSCTPQRGPVNTTRSNIRKVNRIDEPPTDTTIDTTTVSIKTLLQDGFEIFPNPADDMLTLRFFAPANIRRLQLLNALGQTVLYDEHVRLNSSNEKMISVEALPKGIYLLLIETDEGILKRKVLVQ